MLPSTLQREAASTKMKILLIAAIDPYFEPHSRFPNLGLGYLASALLHKFPKGTFDIRITGRDVERALTSWHPDLVGITSISANYGFAMQYAKEAKRLNIPVIIGGPHITTLPETVTKDMDVIVTGEGEESFTQIVREFLETGRLQSVPHPPLIEPLDDIRPPARHLLKIGKHAGIFSSRGCPYRCIFCFSSRYWEKVRYFSADYVIEELGQMAKDYDVRRISFYDDLMIANRERLEKLVEMINRDPVLRKIKYKLNARANLVTDKMARLLSKMHVDNVGMGMESGNEKILRFLKCGSVSVHDNYEAVKNLHRYGIAANASFVIGSPDETEAEIWDTYNFIKSSGLDFVDTYVLVPYPGTPIWDYAKSTGAVNDKDMEWERLNVYHSKVENPIILSKTINKERMAKINNKFQRQRIFLAMRKAWFHPLFPDFCRGGIEKIKCQASHLSS